MADFEQDIILDADGKPIFTALDHVRKQVEQINRDVVNTAKALNAQLVNMGTMLDLQSKEAQQRMSQMRSLAAAKNNPGFAIQDTAQRQKLGKMTTQVTEYARGLDLAGTAVEGFQTRLNRLNDTIAQRGRLGRGETITQTRQRKAWEDQKKAVLDLDNALGKLQSRAGRTNVGPGDRLGAQQAAGRVAETRAALRNAVLDPSRNSFLPEIGRYQAALDGMDQFYSELRTKQAQRLQDERTHARAVERVETQSRDRRAQQEEKMWADRDRQRAADARGSSQRRKEEDKAWEQQNWRNKDMLDAETKKAAYLGDQTEALKKQRQARVSLSEAEKLGLAETERLNNGGLTATDRNALDRKQRAAALDDAKEMAKVRAKELSDLDAVDAARRRNRGNLNSLRAARRAAHDPRDHDFLTRQIKAEQAYAAALRQRRTELERVARAEAKENAATAGGGRGGLFREGGPMATIASPGYMGAAALRTGVYGAAAMGVYALFDTIRGGVSYVVELEDAMAKLQAIANATDQQMSTLKESILDVAGNARFTTVELTKISQNLAQAGVTAGQMKDALEAVVSLANASGSTPDEAVNLVTAALGAFQLQASEAARVADLMVVALNRTRLTVGQAGAAIQYVGATAYEQNITMEELLATASAMAQAGIKSGSTIGTGLRQFLVDLQSPTKKLQEQFDSLGLTTAELDVTTRGLPAVLDSLSKAGFGAAQAYEGLETRAAAAYLVLKNNTGLIDELRLQMTTSGAAADANAKAMDSLSAQWTRFTNLISEAFAEDSVGFFAMIKDGVEALADAMDDGAESADSYRNRVAEGWQGYLDRADGSELQAALAYWNDNLIPDLLKAPLPREWHDNFDRYVLNVNRAGSANEDLQTRINKANEQVETQAGKVAELEKEYQRLLVQKDSLRDNDTRALAEMINLTQRFEDLGLHIDMTKDSYDGLIAAVREYAQVSNSTLAGDLRLAAGEEQNRLDQAAGRANSIFKRLQSDPLDPRWDAAPNIRSTLYSLREGGGIRVGSPEFSQAQARIAAAAVSEGLRDTDLGRDLRLLAQEMSTMTSAFQNREMNNRRADAAEARGTDLGADITDLVDSARAAMTEARSLRDTEQTAKVAEARAFIAAGRELAADNSTPEYQQFYDSQLAELSSIEQSLKAMTTPTKAEQDESARERQARERELARPKIERQDIIDIITAMYDVTVGSGYRSQAEQDSLVRRGVTRATVSDHTTGIGQDFPTGDISDEQGRRMAAAIKARLAAEGINAQVIYENGNGKGQGTGKHIHVGVKAGERYARGKGPDAEDGIIDAERYLKRLAEASKKLNSATLKRLMDDAAVATTGATFEAAVTAAEEAKNRVEADIRAIAASELAGEGLGPLDPEYQVRMLQVEEEIAQLNADFQRKLADAILDNVEVAFEAAERATDRAMADANRAVAIAEARIRGFGYQSMEGRVPDYVRNNAQARAGEAAEARDRQRYTLLGGEIEDKEAALAEAREQLAILSQSDAAYESNKEKVAELADEVRRLREEREALGEALSADELMPKTLGEALDAAAENYRRINNIGRSLNDELIMNMGGALDTIGSGIEGFFTDITSGSMKVQDAFANMVQSMLQWLQKLLAELLAKQIIGYLFQAFGIALGGSGALGGSLGAASQGASQGVASMSSVPMFGYTGGKNDPASFHRLKGYYGGGKVANGHRSHDSVNARLARDEWVVQRSAVESVGDEFMADLNARGAMAVRDAAGGMTQMFQMPKQETNVYVVAPDQKPSLGKGDVVVIMEDHMVHGSGRKLIKSIAQGG